MLIETRVQVDEHKVWERVWGNDGQGFSYWLGKARALDGSDLDYYLDRDKPVNEWVLNPQDFQIWTDDEAGNENYKVTLYSLCKAFADLQAEGWTHCGGCSVKDSDACTEDAILQRAVFGEFVYG